MIKKTILMLLVLVGGVVSANADEVTTKRVWLNLTETNSSWTTAGAVTAIHYGDMEWNTHTLMTEIYMYGKKWCYYDVPSTITTIVFKRCGYNDDNLNYWNWQSVDITWSGTDDLYLKLTEGNKIGYSTLSAPSWNNLTCRNNIKDTWTWTASNTEKDGDTFTYTLTSEEIKSFASYATQGIRFRLYTDDYVNFNEAGSAVNGKPQIYPTSPTLDNGQGETYGEQLDIAGKTFTYYENTDNTNWYWQINVLTYDFSKIVITAKYIYDNGYKWQISADAYVSPTITNDYGTYAVAAPIDLSKMTGIKKAYYASSATGGKVSLTSLNEAVAANTGLFLAKGTGDISIPVAASGTDLSATNKLKAGDGTTSIVSDETTYYYGFQTKPISGPGFYKITSDITVPVGKAYLELSASEAGNAPSFSIELDGETTGLQLINFDSEENIQDNGQMFDLQGRRVAEPTKGVYIVNGKKVVIK